MKAKILTLIVATASCLPSFAQEEWDLRKCIDYAIEHNLSIKHRPSSSGGQHLWQPQHPKHQFLIGNQCTVIHRFADTQQHSSL